MTRKGLTGLYDQLTAEEQFKLVMAAEARKDRQEVERLVNTCPRHLYRMTDWYFYGRCVVAHYLVATLQGSTGIYFGWLAALDFLAEPLGECILALLGEKANGDEHGRVSLYAPRSLEYARQKFARALKSVWEAFADCCREEVGLELDLVIRAHLPRLAERFEQYRELLDGTELDADDYAEHREEFRSVWAAAVPHTG